MSESFDLAKFESYVHRLYPVAELNFHPIGFGDIHLRFELGGDHPNGTDERVQQATQRALTLFRECNSETDQLVLIIHNFSLSGQELWLTDPPRYLQQLLPSMNDDTHTRMLHKDDDEIPAFSQSFVATTANLIDMPALLGGIANREQGRSPKIHEAIYFINQTRGAVFYMYDDRGCMIYANARESIAGLYTNYGDWLVDYHRDHFNNLFG